MAQRGSHEIQAVEPIPPELMREPLEFLFAEHYRHRQMCRALDQVAAAPGFVGEAAAALEAFIAHDLANHVLDEEQDLFPVLRRRSEPEDEIEKLIAVLSQEHALDQQLASVTRGVLAQSIAHLRPVRSFEGGPAALRRLAQQERRHLALENAVIMPIARLRLTVDDKRLLAQAMAARRGYALA